MPYATRRCARISGLSALGTSTMVTSSSSMYPFLGSTQTLFCTSVMLAGFPRGMSLYESNTSRCSRKHTRLVHEDDPASLSREEYEPKNSAMLMSRVKSIRFVLPPRCWRRVRISSSLRYGAYCRASSIRRCCAEPMLKYRLSISYSWR